MVDISDNTKWSQTDASNNTTSPTGWTTGTMLPSQVEPTARMMMGAIKRFYDHINGTVTSGGTNAATLTYTVAPAAYVAGDVYLFKAGGTNTGATTLNVNALGAKTVQRAGAALVAGDITTGYYYGTVYDGTNFQLLYSSAESALGAPASLHRTPANPTGTASLTLVQMGLGCSITPNRHGTVLFIISGDAQNTTAGDGFTYQIRYGSGAGPANAGALAGTAASAAAPEIVGTDRAVPFSTQGIVTGLTVGTAYWFDLALAALTGGTATVTNLTCNALEV